MKLQICIPAINLWNEYTKSCLLSVLSSIKDIDYRILLIDNASTDDTMVEAGKLVSHNFAHKRNEERWSFAKSVNYGVNDAFSRGAEYALVLNNDVLLHPEAISLLIKRFDKGGVGMVTCMDVRGECKDSNDIFTFSIKDKENVPEAPHPNFSAFMVNKECWDKVGEFDEGFEKAYFEDNDFHYRMKLAGLEAIVYPPAVFYHFGSRTQKEADTRPIVSSPDFERNRLYFTSKWGSSPGQEKFKNPFDDKEKDYKWVKQLQK